MKDIEVRTIQGEVRATGEGEAKLSGSAVTYGHLSEDLGGFREQFAPGALDDLLDNPDLRVINQHDRAFVFGRVGAGTARFSVRDGRVLYEADPPDAQWARDAMASIKRNDIYQSSFAFRVAEGGDTYERKGDTIIRTVHKVSDFVEAGPQTTPAYRTTSTVARALEKFGVKHGDADLYRRKALLAGLD